MLFPLALASALLQPAPAPVHCQVPCGIYGDHLRFELLEEHAATIEKAMQQIEAIGAEAKPNWNQLVRWVETKEQHAQEVQDQVAEYWLAQRIKEPTGPSGSDEYKKAEDRYVAELVFAHRIITKAMACKQTTDAGHVASLREAAKSLRLVRMGPEETRHLEEGHAHAEHSHAEHAAPSGSTGLDGETLAKIGVAKASLRVLSQAVTEFAINNAGLPEDLEILVIKDASGASYIAADELPKDPWGFDYVYKKTGSLEFQVISYGSDGEPGGVGAAADLVSDALDDK